MNYLLRTSSNEKQLSETDDVGYNENNNWDGELHFQVIFVVNTSAYEYATCE